MWKAIFTSGISLSLCLAARAQIIVTTSQYGVTFTQAVVLGTTEPVTFYQCTFKGSGVLLSIGSSQNVTGQDCAFYGLNPNVYGAGGPVGILANGVAKLYLFNCQFTGLRIGVLEDGAWGSPDIDYWACTFSHNNNRLSDGQGGWLAQVGWGFGVCFMHTKGYNSGTHAFKITNCNFVNDLGVDEPGDQINVYESSGLIVANNRIEGARGLIGSDVHGNGIVTDDEWADAWQKRGLAPGDYDWTTSGCVFENNTLVNATIGVWAGHDNQFIGNTVINSNFTDVGTGLPLVGIERDTPEGSAWAQTNVVSGNRVSSFFQGQDYSYQDNAGGVNWSSNTEF